jgi:hypothetical protein
VITKDKVQLKKILSMEYQKLKTMLGAHLKSTYYFCSDCLSNKLDKMLDFISFTYSNQQCPRSEVWWAMELELLHPGHFYKIALRNYCYTRLATFCQSVYLTFEKVVFAIVWMEHTNQATGLRQPFHYTVLIRNSLHTQFVAPHFDSDNRPNRSISHSV